MSRRFSPLGGALLLALASSVRGGVLYYNDGTVNDFTETFGDVAIGVPWNHVFEPGGWRDGSPDDIPPFNTIDNLGLITKKGLAGGVNGGGFQKFIPLRPAGAAAPRRGAIVATYGTVSERKQSPGTSWAMRFVKLAEQLGTDWAGAIAAWQDGLMMNGRLVKLLKYVGDPMISPPTTDLTPAQLDPIDLPAVQAALASDHAHLIFWEVEGSFDMDTLNLMIGDYNAGHGYLDLEHHYPMLAVLGGVGPEDFGINRADALIQTFNGSAVGGDFTGGIQIITEDPIPEPTTCVTLTIFAGIAVGVGRMGYRRRQRS